MLNKVFSKDEILQTSDLNNIINEINNFICFYPIVVNDMEFAMTSQISTDNYIYYVNLNNNTYDFYEYRAMGESEEYVKTQSNIPCTSTFTGSRLYYNKAIKKLYCYNLDTSIKFIDINSGLANSTNGGLMTTSNQTISGSKTFTNNIIIDTNLGNSSYGWNVYANNINSSINSDINYKMNIETISENKNYCITGKEMKYNFITCSSCLTITLYALASTVEYAKDILFCIYNSSDKIVTARFLSSDDELVFANMFTPYILIPAGKTLEIVYTYWGNKICTLNGALSIN